MIKHFLSIIIVLCPVLAQQQAGFIECDHPVYNYLARMKTLQFIDGYDSSELPKTRKEVCKYISDLKNKYAFLNAIDKEILEKYLIEFEYDLYGTTENYNSLVSDFNPSEITGAKEKYLYFHTDSTAGSIFINLTGESTYLSDYNRVSEESRNAGLIKFGGTIRGTIGENFGFYIKATNGTFRGNKDLTFNNTSLKYNYKYSSNAESQTATDYFDETEGYFTADFDFINFKIGRDRNLIGHGPVKTILGESAPPMDYLSLNLKYSRFKYSFLHGKLLGSESTSHDVNQGSIREIEDKYFVYHKFGLDLGKHFNISLGEMVIYSRRSIDLSYLNPFNFYKSVEHLNQDRDNTLLFADIENNSIKGLRLFGSVIIDDIDFGKIGTGWYGNKVLWNFGFSSTLFYNYFPVDLDFQYLRVEPYVYTHRIPDNNYTTLGYSLVDPLQPNSQVFSLQLNYYLSANMNIKIGFRYSEHAANTYDENGELISNYGGDVLFGHRPGDPDKINFLEGKKEHLRQTVLEIIYEPINNYFIKCNVLYNNCDLADGIKNKYVLGTFTASVRI